MNSVNPALVNISWLVDHLHDPHIKVVDASFYPEGKPDAAAEYQARHIPGAVFFDIDEIADKKNSLPRMLPPAEQFSSHMRRLGIGDQNHVICYDSAGMLSAARAWWMLRVFGHDRVSVLDGGLPKWVKEGHEVTDQAVQVIGSHFTGKYRPELVRSVEQVQENLVSGREQIIDARSAERFSGLLPEHKPGLRSGHIPGARNVPYASLLDRDKCFKSAVEIAAIFSDAGVDVNKPMATHCGSGVTACVDALALYLLGEHNVPVYDGSWSEWGSRDDLPISI